MTDRTKTSRYPSRTVIVWSASWAAGAPAYPMSPARDPSTSLREYVAIYKDWMDAHDRWRAWWRDQKARLPSVEETGGWREHRCAACSALLADVHPPTREEGTIVPELGLKGIGFHHQTPFAILVPGLTRELDTTGKPRRDAQGRPFFGPPRRRRFRRGMSPSSEGIPRPFMRHPDAGTGACAFRADVDTIPANRWYANSSSDIRSFTTVASHGSQYEGRMVCRYSYPSGNTCGVITDDDVPKPNGEGHTITHAWVWNKDSTGGDSGGTMILWYQDPVTFEVFENVAGVHIHSSDDTWCGNHPGQCHSWYSTAQQLQNNTSLVVCTSSSC